ncbi:MAG: pullulanase-associated domain-containing protein, partial [Rubrivivax sp.]
MLSWCFGNALGGLQREPAGVRPGGWRAAVVALSLLVLSACGGGGSSASAPPASPPPPAPAPAPDARLALGNAGPATVLHAVPAPPPVTSPGNPPGTEPTTLTVHYQRTAGDYDGWQIHTWNTAVDPGWNQGHNAAARTAFGVRYEVPLKGNSGEVGYLFHKGDEKDHGGRDQTYVLKPGKNEIWRLQGDDRTYTALPGSSGPPDVHTVRVHYKRFAADHADWGLHLWPASGIDTGRLPPGLVIDQWNAPVRFAQMPNFTMSGSDAVFDLPVRNPRSGGPGTVEFIIHGLPPRVDDKDGRNDNIRIDLAALNVRQQVGEVWLVQGDATVYTRVPDTRRASTTDARAVWLDGRLLRWPRVAAGGGPIKLYHSATGQITAPLDGPVAGADGAVVLEAVAAPLPAPLAERFKWVESGVTLRVPDGDAARVKTLLKSQLVLVQEDAAGRVMNATTAQLPGALDALYAAAEAVPDLGVKIAGGQTQFKLWAPTARQVLLFTYDTPDGPAVTVDEMREDPATGVFSATRSGDLTGKSYRFAVDVFVRGTGVVRNLVTDPYSVTLTANSQRSVVADLASPALKPPGWESSPVPARVASTVDMVVYELHVRDFSAHDASVSPANRGKYLAFTEPQSAGMKHLAALSQAGVTDVHLLPVFDLASIPEVGCATPAPAGPPDGEAQQAAVAATAGRDCFNWGYDPWHFNAPEGSYATDANDGLRRIVEFRRMVMGLHAAGLRVGMDVVY